MRDTMLSARVNLPVHNDAKLERGWLTLSYKDALRVAEWATEQKRLRDEFAEQLRTESPTLKTG